MHGKKQWIELHLPLHPDGLEILSAELFAAGADGLEELEKEIVVYFPRESWNNESKLLIAERLERLLPGFKREDINEQILWEENWNEAWKESFKTFHLTRRIVIVPEWETYQPNDEETCIVISPKMAFGTGHHETTRLLLEILETELKAGQSVLDAGTGSGILAIYAAKRGAQPVVAFDIDPLAVENTKENLGLNGVQDRVTVLQGTLEQVPPARYDLIMANINRNVLLDLAGTFGTYNKKGGLLLLSGILKQDEQNLTAAFEEAGYRLLRTAGKNEWIALVLRWEGHA